MVKFWIFIFNSSPYSYQLTQNAGVYACQTPGEVNGAGITLVFAYLTNGSYVVTLRYAVKNACGSSTFSPGNYYTVQACGFSFIVSPNPTTGTLDVGVNQQSLESSNTMSIQEIQITDKLGSVVKHIKYNGINKRVTINISDLKNDVYFIRIFDGKTWEPQTIIKQ
jgi:hypothetical protein